ncbi:helix-turn-helix domain-containing protein [Vibrio nitrifigilis]|uniref:Helix-turn-helix transcriptional regulator n=1 Tax=Vibrio nitrifigilis TaxID=2789781 RepID=A0ABS0GGM5_9VIBR|nr:helix-turn-helix transcriptional regulator [Vibrio nitrifigilis]MBF9001584.1 helix-turn-helix transcriptional regulator [Vibrio nitrifigilis]
MSTDNPIPKRLKEARKKMKISQKNWGLVSVWNLVQRVARMNQYEKGVHTPDVRTLKLLAKELGVPLNYFFCEDDSTAEIATAIFKIIRRARNQVIEFINSLQERDK